MDRKLTIKNYLGYAFCDISGMLSFSVISAYLSVFYTDILKISTFAIFCIMVSARIWDAINDPIMGFLVQNRKHGRYGKYRPFLLIGGIPLAIISVLMFIKIPGLSTAGYTAYAAVTYILAGMCYTVVLIPYGSLATVMTTKENERSILSMCRSIGGGVGSIPASLIFPLVVIVNNVLNGRRLAIAMTILASLMIVLYTVSFRWVGEYTESAAVSEKIKVADTLRNLLKDKAFVILALVGCLDIAAGMYINTVNIYIFKDYYGKSGLLSILTLIAYIPILSMVPFMNTLIKKFGKKVLAITGLTICTLTTLFIFVLRFSNPWLYIGASFFLNIGIGFLMLEIWAMAMDVIDHQEWVTGKRAEAADYAVFTFMRKIGQALASLAPLLVGWAGYRIDQVGIGQSAPTLERMYTVATLVPFLFYSIMLMLMICYPLNKLTMERMKNELAERHTNIILERQTVLSK